VFEHGCHLAFFETVCHKKYDLAIWPILNVEENIIFRL